MRNLTGLAAIAWLTLLTPACTAERAKVHASVLDLYELDKIRAGTCTYR